MVDAIARDRQMEVLRNPNETYDPERPPGAGEVADGAIDGRRVGVESYRSLF